MVVAPDQLDEMDLSEQEIYLFVRSYQYDSNACAYCNGGRNHLHQLDLLSSKDATIDEVHHIDSLGVVAPNQ